MRTRKSERERERGNGLAERDKFRDMRVRLAARISRMHKRTKSAEGHSIMRQKRRHGARRESDAAIRGRGNGRSETETTTM